MALSRADALDLVHEYTASEALRRHMLAVELAMRAMAARAGEDPERWGLVGLLHDFDYERYPNAAHSPTDEHPSEGVRLLRARVDLPASRRWNEGCHQGQGPQCFHVSVHHQD